MARSSRWSYMAQPNYNPPCDDCPECKKPSKVYFIGAKRVGDFTQKRYKCEYHHEWLVKEPVRTQ